jgi:hypothetical protein
VRDVINVKYLVGADGAKGCFLSKFIHHC